MENELNVLIICTGNICRSPMAEFLFRHYFSQIDNKVNVSSAGVNALVGYSPAIFAQQVMKEMKNIDISLHRARQLTLPMLFKADLILVMEQQLKKKIEFNIASLCGRVHRLGEWNNLEIPDPYRQPKHFFEQTLVLIEKSLVAWKSHLWNYA